MFFRLPKVCQSKSVCSSRGSVVVSASSRDHGGQRTFVSLVPVVVRVSNRRSRVHTPVTNKTGSDGLSPAGLRHVQESFFTETSEIVRIGSGLGESRSVDISRKTRGWRRILRPRKVST